MLTQPLVTMYSGFFRPNYMPSSKKHTGVNFKDQLLSRICLSAKKVKDMVC